MNGCDMQANRHVKPRILLDFSNPAVRELISFIDQIRKIHKDSAEPPIAIKVLECLAFIKLNSAWIAYAVENKEKDRSIYTFAEDEAKQVLRDHNGLAFHIVSYNNAETALRDYDRLILSVETGIKEIRNNPEQVAIFIDRFLDSEAGCMEARLANALEYLATRDLPDINDLLKEFSLSEFESCNNLHGALNFFKDHINKSFKNGKSTVKLSWNKVKDFLINVLSIDEDIFSIDNLYENALLSYEKDKLILSFAEERDAILYERLLRMHSLVDLQGKSSQKVTLNKDVALLAYQISFLQQEFNDIVINSQLSSKQAVACDIKLLGDYIYQSIAADNEVAFATLIETYPALLQFCFGSNGFTLLHAAIESKSKKIFDLLLTNKGMDCNKPTHTMGLTTDGMTPLLYTTALGEDYLEYFAALINSGARADIACATGQTPLLFATASNQRQMIAALLQLPHCSYNSIGEKGTTALINAVEYCNDDVVEELLVKKDININHKRIDGESALFIAAKLGHERQVKLLLCVPTIDLHALRYTDNYSAARISIENGFQHIATTIEQRLQALINHNEAKFDKDFLGKSYLMFSKTLRKVPSDYHRLIFSRTLAERGMKGPAEIERGQVLARKLWSDVIATTYEYNNQVTQDKSFRDLNIERVKAFFPKNPEIHYDALVDFITNQSVITVTFDKDKMIEEVTDTQLLNMWERDIRTNNEYRKQRDWAESQIFSYLPQPLREVFQENYFARPRYGALRFMDSKHPLDATREYGRSFITIKDLVKQGALFLPCNPFNSLQMGVKHTPCTFQHVDMLINQFSKEQLFYYLNRVNNSRFYRDFNQDSWQPQTGGYPVVLLPAIPILDINQVESIFLKKERSEQDHAAIRQLVTSQSEHVPSVFYQEASPYYDLGDELFDYILKDDVASVISLISRYPSLSKMNDLASHSPIHLAAKRGKIETLKYLANIPELRNQTGIYGTPLHIALSNDQMESVSVLIKHGADINACNLRSESIFEHAVKKESGFLVAFMNLLDQSILPKNIDRALVSLITRKCFDDFFIVLNYFRDNYKPEQLLPNIMFHALNSFDVKKLDSLIRLGADISAPFNDACDSFTWVNQTPIQLIGDTPLHFAVMKDSIEFVILLLKHGADYKVVNDEGRTPAHYASGQVKYLFELLQYFESRANEEDQYKSFEVFGRRMLSKELSVFGRPVNISKESKLAAAQALKEIIFNGANPRILEDHKAALTNGNLHEIYIGLNLSDILAKKMSNYYVFSRPVRLLQRTDDQDHSSIKPKF